MTGRSVRKLLTRTLVAAACVLGVAGAAPAIAEVGDNGASPAPRVVELPKTPPKPGVETPHMEVRPANPDSFTLIVRPHGRSARTVVLNCKPIGGNHPAAREACGQLTAARGEVAAIPPADTLCTAEYAPVTVLARGTWHANPRAYRHTFSNLCVAVRDTGGVLFNF